MSTLPVPVAADGGNLPVPVDTGAPETPKKKRGGTYQQRPGTVQRGMKIRLYPRSSSLVALKEWERQTRVFDLWSRRARELWNLLLRMQRALYSGAKDLEHLGWRQMLVEVVQENYRLACERYEQQFPGGLANPPPAADPIPILMERLGEEPTLAGAPDVREVADLLMATLKADTRRDAEERLLERLALAVATPTGGWALVKQLRQVAKAAVKEAKASTPKQPPTPPDIDRILARNCMRPDGTYIEPGIFMWESDCQKVMALLKKKPHTRWIADLPSHACQDVVKNLCRALGNVSKGWGFPAFKRQTPDGESVYFANTQLRWDIEGQRVKFPGVEGRPDLAVGWVHFEGGRAARKLRLIAKQTIAPKEGDGKLRRTGDDKFLGARLWRRGKKWWLSPQFEMLAKPAPRFKGRHVAVKVAASTLATVYDGVSFKEFTTPPEPRHRHADLMRRSRSRSVEAIAAKKRKATLRSKNHRVAKGLPPLPRSARIRRSKEFLEVNAAISKTEARDVNVRTDSQHKLSRRIVRMGDSLTIERYDVAALMRKEKNPAKRKEAMRRRTLTRKGEAAPDEVVHKAPPLVLRKAVKRAAIARFLTLLKYKAEEGGRPVNEQHEFDPRVIKCGAKIKDGDRQGEICGHLNYVMKDGRQLHRCSSCGAVMRRNINAAENIFEGGRLSRESGLEAAE